MFNHLHYVPLLKGKQGEYGALRELADAAKERLTPLVDVPPIPWDYDKEKPAKSIESHLKSVPVNIAKAWGKQRPIFLDLYYVEPGKMTKDGRHPLTWILEKARECEIILIPTTGFDRDDSYQDAVRKAAGTDQRGVCLRVGSEDIEDIGEMRDAAKQLLKRCSLSPEACDVILDLREISARDLNGLCEHICDVLRAFPYVNRWRTFTLAGSSFPMSLSGIQSNSVQAITRAELNLWKKVQADAKNLPRIPSFGDYGICHPEFPDFDMKLMRMSVNLRYTTEAKWLVFKGRDARRFGYDQFNELCAELVDRKEFAGPDFSWGDSYVERCANDLDGPGNASSWRKAGTNHHLTLVGEQVANAAAV